MTTNAVDPYDFVHVRPPNLFSMGADGIAMITPDGRAILKRISWLHVQDNLLPANVMQNFRGAAQSSTGSRFDMIFSGAFAIP